MKKLSKQFVALNLPSLRLEGGLFLPDQLERAALGQAQHQTEADYQIPPGLKIKDEYSRAFQIAEALWRKFEAQFERADLDDQVVTDKFVEELLKHGFGYPELAHISGITVHERRYPVTALLGSVVLVVAPHSVGLEEPREQFAVEGSGSRRKSAFQLAQECLNASDEHLWALVSNGRQIRLLRDAAALTRPSYLEIDLQDILAGRRYAEFEMAWRLLHASRAPILPSPPGRGAGGEGVLEGGESIWERWRDIGNEEGTRVREGLREGVTDALMTLGSGYLAHPANEGLRHALQQGDLSSDAYFQQLLRLVYRLIFLFNVEERGLLHPQDDDPAARRAREVYAEGYAMARLRGYCLKRRARNRHDDLWQAARIVFKGLVNGEPRLALPALGGLFAESQCAEIDAADLDNAHWLKAIAALRWSKREGSLAPVDYRNMGPEELGSVYESLLELVPELDLPARRFGFVGLTSEGSTAGNARKLTGSYYTPDSLVQELIQSALEPVIEQCLAEHPERPVDALLDIKVIDPACGSGHFLLAAARRLAERLARLRAVDGAIRDSDYRHALREVIAHCIYGVDRNPMAIELARTALWLEGFEEGRPLGFLDHHLQCGDALLGVMDLKSLELGIPKDAFKALSGDEKDVCKALTKSNADGLKQFKKDLDRKLTIPISLADTDDLAALRAIETMPEDSTEQIAAKEQAFRDYLEQARDNRLHHAADILVGAYLLPKVGNVVDLPTSKTLYLELRSEHHNEMHRRQREAARRACAEARVFHWPLAFPQVFARGGFDCVLGNPPWERIKLQEEEFFATRNPLITEAKNKAERAQRIDWLAHGQLASNLYPDMPVSEEAKKKERELFEEFMSARRSAEAASVFVHVNGPDGGRYPLTGVGDVNTYALFAETITEITAPWGCAGFIVPSGLATDNTTKVFFGDLVTRKALVSFFEFENEGFFPEAGQGHMLRFALTTVVGRNQQIEETKYLFQGKKIESLGDPERVFTLSAEDIERVNPNTLTCPIFQSRFDAEITKKIYRQVPVLIREGQEGKPESNPWKITFMAMFHMANDSHLFRTYDDLVRDSFDLDGNRFVRDERQFVPLYEAKMIHQYNHRHGDFSETEGNRAHVLPSVPTEKLKDAHYYPRPYYWVDELEVDQVLAQKEWDHGWLIGWRDVTDARASVRTLVASVFPRSAVNHKFLLMLPRMPARLCAALLANLDTLVCDYIARQKVGGLSFPYFIMKQLPVITPNSYQNFDLEFIVPRVLELTFNTWDMEAWARDLGYEGDPFLFDPERRAHLSAELDAYYARLYGLTRDELRYILDPADVMGEDYPSETFRVLKNKEMREFGEYRTRRLVLEAWDKLQSGELN